MNLETISHTSDEETNDRRWNFESTNPKEILFKHMVEGQIMTAYEDDLKSVGITEESIDNFNEAFLDSTITERDREIFYCVPYELRLRQFKANLPEKEEGEHISTEEWIAFIKEIIDINKDSDPHLGFHVSPFEVKKGEVPRGGTRAEWTIRGTERDHRNDDHAMAYYSLSVERLFTQKGLHHLYAVRGNLAEGYNNYPDNDGHWGRAASLSIIAKIDLKGRNLNELLREMEESLDQVNEKSPEA